MPYLRANTNAAFGAIPYDRVLRISPYVKLAAYATRIFPGDFVTLASTGGVQVAASGDLLLGVAVADGPASTLNNNFMVYDHPDQLFAVQNDDSGTATAQTNVGNNTNIVATTGDTNLVRSLHQAQQSGWGTASAQLRLVAAHPIEGATPTFGSNRKIIVRINTHIYGPASITGV